MSFTMIDSDRWPRDGQERWGFPLKFKATLARAGPSLCIMGADRLAKGDPRSLKVRFTFAQRVSCGAYGGVAGHGLREPGLLCPADKVCWLDYRPNGPGKASLGVLNRVLGKLAI